MALTYSIEVATVPGSSNDSKGLLLERFATKLLDAENFDVVNRVRLVGTEVDLLATDRETKEKIIVECKAYRQTISANVLKQLWGDVGLQEYAAGWLISTFALGKDAKGVREQFSRRPPHERRRLKIFEPQDLVRRLVELKIFVEPESLVTPKEFRTPEELFWLITERGSFYAIPLVDKNSGIRNAVAIFDPITGQPVFERKILDFIRTTDTELSSLDWNIGQSHLQEHTDATLDQITNIVQVPVAEFWADYRPARPVDFVGRTNIQKDILQFLERVRDNQTRTRLFALTGPSGWGKSSLVLKIAHNVRNKRNKKRYFVYTVDSRSAPKKRFGEFALAAMIRAAIDANFISESHLLNFGGASQPFATSSMQKILTELQSEQKILCLIFDQFEELFAREEMSNCFDEIRSICDAVDSAQENIVVGFSWKSGGVIPQEHRAYHLWQSLADRRLDFSLSQFTPVEVSAARRKFENEIGQSLIPQLRQMIEDSSQGFPWLLKKLCIHVMGLLRAGQDQNEIALNYLKIKDLFEIDIERLTPSELSCLKEIAQKAPAEFFQVRDNYDDDTLNNLIDKRLVIRSGQRLSVYWDIFRDFLLTNRIPEIPITYVPHTAIATYAKAVTYLAENRVTNFRDISRHFRLSRGKIGTLLRDLVAIGHADFDSEKREFAARFQTIEEADQILIRFCTSHEMFRYISALGDNYYEIDAKKFMSLTIERCRLIGRAKLSAEFYVKNLIRYFWVSGILAPSGNTLKFNVQNPDKYYSIDQGAMFFRRRHYMFFGEAPPQRVAACLASLIQTPIAPDQAKNMFERNSETERSLGRNNVYSLVKFGLIAFDGKPTIPNESLHLPIDEIVRTAASKNDVLSFVRKILRLNPFVSGQEIGLAVGKEFERKWKPASARRTGGALARWVVWIDNNADTEESNVQDRVADYVQILLGPSSVAGNLISKGRFTGQKGSNGKGRRPKINSDLAQAIQIILKQRKLSIQDVAHKLGVTRLTIERALARLHEVGGTAVEPEHITDLFQPTDGP
jgi:hypothetical protein